MNARAPSSGRTGQPSPPVPATGVLPIDLWVPGPGLELVRDVPERLAGWLTEPRLLTDRIRREGSRPCRVRLVEQRVGFLGRDQMGVLDVTAPACLVREVELLSGDAPWVFAQTLMPDATLELHPWLAELGECSLGETLAGVKGLERGPFEFAALPAAHPLAARALASCADDSDFLWARRSWFAVTGRRLLVQEVFLPELGR